MEDAIGQVLQAWRTNQRINDFLIDNISTEGMKCTLSTRGGRNVVRQFCHVHNVRFWHLEACAKELAKGLIAFLGYLIAHQSHHRSNILLTLKQSGHSLDQAARYKLWDRDRI